ncbi:MAG: 30S ribosomal protein S20 [Bacteroidetes bacterium]|nr:30S ribosomal protein S20 [Bacteroidota bacterium]
MAHHKSAIKRIRQNGISRLRNRYQFKVVRNSIRKFKTIKEKEEEEKEFDKLSSLIDKLAKRGVIHQNNAANKKASLAKYIAHLS